MSHRVKNLLYLTALTNQLSERLLVEGLTEELDREFRDLRSRISQHEAIHGELPFVAEVSRQLG